MDEDPQAHRQRAAWQQKLLPLMGAVLILAALFFSVMSVIELRDLYSRVAHQPFDLDGMLQRYENAQDGAAVADGDYLRFKVLALLEADALQRRYHQANATMLARVWTRQLGFITGMLIALVGAAFILGRLQESTTTAEFEAEGVKAALATASPGIVLAVLGTALMALTIWIPFGVETRDVNVYLRAANTLNLPAPSRVTMEAREDVDQPDTATSDPEERRLFGGPDATPGGNRP